MTAFYGEDKESDTFQKVRPAILDALEHLYGDTCPRSLAWDLSAKLHIPAYIIFRICMDLVKRGEVTLINDKLHGKAANPSFRNMSPLQSPLGIDTIQKKLFAHQERGRWDFFRELIAYYIQCLRLEEGGAAKVWQNTLGEQFIFLSGVGRWYPRDNILWQKNISFQEISGALKDLWRDSATTTLMLGYPISAVIGKNGEILLRPVFCYVLDHRFTSTGLEVKARLTKPSINAAWLEDAFSKSREKRTFLEACGMYASADGDDDTDNEAGIADHGGDAPDFFHLAQILSSAQHRRVRETLDTRCLSDRPLEPSCRSGLYNRAMIVASRCSMYSKGLVAELQTIAKTPDVLLDKTALAYIFAEGQPPLQKGRLASGAAVAEHQLTGTQRRAVASLLERPLTIIQGPPGTGKSQVVSSAVFNARLRGQSVLISSYNHKALDAVMERLGTPTAGRPLVTRCNAKNDPNLSFGMVDALKVMLSMPTDDGTDTRRLDDFCRLLADRGEKSLTAEELEQYGRELGALGEDLRQNLRCVLTCPLSYSAKTRLLSQRRILRLTCHVKMHIKYQFLGSPSDKDGHREKQVPSHHVCSNALSNTASSRRFPRIRRGEQSGRNAEVQSDKSFWWRQHISAKKQISRSERSNLWSPIMSQEKMRS